MRFRLARVLALVILGVVVRSQAGAQWLPASDRTPSVDEGPALPSRPGIVGVEPTPVPAEAAIRFTVPRFVRMR